MTFNNLTKRNYYVQEPQEVENHRTVRHHCPHRHRQFLPHPELQKLGHTDLTDPTDNHVAFMDDKVTRISRIPQIIMVPLIVLTPDR